MEVILCQYLFWCIHVRIDVPLWIRKGYAFSVELRRIELIISVPFLRKLKQYYLINRSCDYRELSVCVLRFFHSRFNSTSVFRGPMGDFKVPCLFFRSEAWHKLQLCRTRRPVLGTFKPLACLAMFVYLSSVVLVYKVRWLTLNYYNSWLIDIEEVKEFVIVGSKENEITITNPAKYEETPGNINSTTEKRTRCTSVMTIWTLLCFHIVYQFSLQQFVFLC